MGKGAPAAGAQPQGDFWWLVRITDVEKKGVSDNPSYAKR